MPRPNRVGPRVNRTGGRTLYSEYVQRDAAMQECGAQDNSALRVAVPSGIGDIAWVLQKLACLKRPVYVHVGCGHPQRGLPLVALSDTCVGGDYKGLDTSACLALGEKTGCLSREELETTDRMVVLQANTHLEAGQRIEDWLPDLDTTYRLPLTLTAAGRWQAEHAWPEHERCVVIYPSSYAAVKAWDGWDSKRWVEFAVRAVRAGLVDRVALVGAAWDVELAFDICVRLAEAMVPFVNLVGVADLSATLACLQRADAVVGFPSGLPIMASLMGTPAWMFYPESLESMQNTWAAPEDIASGRYVGSQFCAPEAVVEWLSGQAIQRVVPGRAFDLAAGSWDGTLSRSA